ncbi:MAG: hypothetical protein HFE83_02320 [Lachnospiraceae bacterium]|jgi:hypothetical protein|nr:hypothetical protein [Lachnospiraceae bacterium]
MKGQVIGKSMLYGYAGSYSRQPDMIVDTHPLGGTEELLFGAPVANGANGAVEAWKTTTTANQFMGIAVRGVKSALDFLNQNEGVFRPGEAVPVLKRGCVNVICQVGTPAAGGKVYIRIKKNEAKPNAVVGGFEAAEDKTETEVYTAVLTNAQWKGAADANGVAELCILTRNHA